MINLYWKQYQMVFLIFTLIKIMTNTLKDMHFLTKFELNQRSLTDVLNSVYEQEDKNILRIIEYSQLSVSNESIQTIFERIVATVES